jgi:hypothetical protein
VQHSLIRCPIGSAASSLEAGAARDWVGTQSATDSGTAWSQIFRHAPAGGARGWSLCTSCWALAPLWLRSRANRHPCSSLYRWMLGQPPRRCRISTTRAALWSSSKSMAQKACPVRCFTVTTQRRNGALGSTPSHALRKIANVCSWRSSACWHVLRWGQWKAGRVHATPADGCLAIRPRKSPRSITSGSPRPARRMKSLGILSPARKNQ